MATLITLEKIKLAIRRSHNKLDEDLQADIDACLADLRRVGITYKDETDPLIFNAIKIYCKAMDTDDVAKSAEFLRRYETLRACLQSAEGYGWEETSDE